MVRLHNTNKMRMSLQAQRRTCRGDTADTVSHITHNTTSDGPNDLVDQMEMFQIPNHCHWVPHTWHDPI